jgi:hypothetical protein
MRNKDPVLWAALRLHRTLCPAPQHNDLAERTQDLVVQQQVLARLSDTLATATTRGWHAAASVVRERLLAQAARVQGACAELGRDRGGRRLRRASVADLLADLRQLEDEFDRVEVQLRERQVRVTTGPITLDGISLGPFSIRLDLTRLVARRDASAFAVVAEAPNPASGSGEVTHPHVSGESLCAGEATVPIAAALAEGRIADAFCLVSAVLHTYNASSAYVQLSAWEGVGCADCGGSVDRDDLCYCESCDGDYCASCISSCGRCDRTLCMGCMDEDADGEPVCGRCARECRRCGGAAEAAHLRRQDGLCDDCLAEDEAERADDEEADGDDHADVTAAADADSAATELTPTPSPTEHADERQPEGSEDSDDGAAAAAAAAVLAPA